MNSSINSTSIRAALRLAWVDSVDRRDQLSAIASAERLSHAKATAKHLFEELDGLTVRVADRSWHITVFSVYDEGDRRWVQVGLHSPDRRQDYSLTLCIRIDEGVSHAIRILSSWLANPCDTARIRNVA
jgi:hypothetical protein